jgi:hypothetical protein
MKNLKNNFFLLLTFSFFGCVTQSVFEINSFPSKDGYDDYHAIKVNSNRIVQECLFLNAEDENKWRHQYTMYVLNDKGEVIPVMYSIHQEKSVCLAHLKKVEKILKKDQQVKLCVKDKLTADISDSTLYDFGALGKHFARYDLLTFESICNSSECYNYNLRSICN